MSSAPSKAIILASGRGVRRLDAEQSTPSPLVQTAQGQAILDKQIGSLRRTGVSDIVCLAGYHIEKLVDTRSEIDYYYDPDWQAGGNVAGLAEHPDVLDGGGDAVIATGETLFDQAAIDTLCRTTADVAVAVARFPSDEAAREGRRTLDETELVALRDGQLVTEVPDDSLPDARLLELAYLSETGSKRLSDEVTSLTAQESDDSPLSFIDVLSRLTAGGVDVQAIDVGESAQQYDESHALARFLLGTKADTLDRLDGLIESARILDHVVFDVASWESNPGTLLDEVQSQFPQGPVVARSSAVAEDGWQDSQAGAFHTELGVDPGDRDALRESIGQVVESLNEGSGLDERDQVLVQPQVASVAMSGVAFTRELDSGGPYTVINYDEVSDRTDTVTAGQGDHHRTAYFYHGADIDDSVDAGDHLSSVKRAVDELRELLDDPPLDVEFAVDGDGDVITLQVRPLSVHTSEDRYDTRDVHDEIESVAHTVRDRQEPRPHLLGEGTVFGVMPDWNPAEMIGTNPDPLATSLYQYLITDDVWARARAESGYRDVRPTPLLITLAGQPYIDALADFNSFLPATLPEELGERLVNHYVDRLHNNPELQDKVEFDVAFTCLDFSFEERATQLSPAGFTTDEIATIRTHLRDLTDDIVTGERGPIETQLDRLEELGRRRRAVLDADVDSWSAAVRCVQLLLDDTREFGTLPFAILARYAFIATSFLQSLRDRGVLTAAEYEAISEGTPTIAQELATDIRRLREGDLAADAFFTRYGHLRPGTYDIRSNRYDSDPDGYFDVDGPSFDPLELDRRRESLVSDWSPSVSPEARAAFDGARDDIQELIDEAGFSFSPEDLFSFVTRAVPLRELAKFEFTRTLSAALTLLRRHGSAELGLTPDELATLRVETLLEPVSENQSPVLGRELERTINHNSKRAAIQDRVQLPPLVRGADDVYSFEVASERPNFITNGSVTAPVARLDESDGPAQGQTPDGKIVLIPSADPGYDWIFGSDIAGLVTMYGGVASHMAIRAAEFGLPAAIGAGEVVYEDMAGAEVVELDCEAGILREVR